MRRSRKNRPPIPTGELAPSDAAIEDRRRRRPPQPPGRVDPNRPYGRRKTDRRPGEAVLCSVDPVEAQAEIETRLDDAFGIFETKAPATNPMHESRLNSASEVTCPNCRAGLDGMGDQELAIEGQICPYCLLPLGGPEPLDQ